MDPHLSQTSTLTGLGFDSQNQPALKLRKNILETASFSSDARPPQMKKRLHKMKTKQEQDQFEMNNLCAEIDSNPSHNDKDFSNDHYEFKDFAPSSLNSAPTKRRRITEDSQDWNLSQCSHANFSTQSHSDSLAKEHDSPKHEQKLQNEDSPNKTFQNFHQYEEERLRSEADSSAYENTTPKKSTCTETAANLVAQVAQDLESNNAPTSSPQDRINSTLVEETNSLDKLLSVARSLCCALKGKLLSTEVVSGRGGNKGLSFECCNDHQFFISLSALGRLISSIPKSSHDYWCLKCRNFLHKTLERAKEMNSIVLDSCLSKGYVEVKCVNHHQFTIGYTKNHHKTWCEQCKSEEIQKKQSEYKDKEKTEEQRKQREQQKLFEESQRYMEQQKSQQSRAFYNQDEAIYFEKYVQQVCLIAKKKTQQEMSSPSFKGQTTSTEIYNVYKILYMPENFLVKTFVMMPQPQLNTYYRQLALLVHPDKNKHACAKDAFAKLANAFGLAKKLF